MAIVSKEIDLFAWRKNNINIIAVSQENVGRQIVCNLYKENLNNKALNSGSKSFEPYLYVNISSNSAAYVVGTLDKTNSKVTFNLESNLLPHCGRFSCFVSLVSDSTVLKFSGMTLSVLDGNTDKYVNNVMSTDAFTVCLSDVAYLKDVIGTAINSGDTNLDVIQSRTDSEGTTFTSLSERLNTHDNEVINSRTDNSGNTYDTLTLRLKAMDKQIAKLSQKNYLAPFTNSKNLISPTKNFNDDNIINIYSPIDDDCTLSIYNKTLFATVPYGKSSGITITAGNNLTLDTFKSNEILIRFRSKSGTGTIKPVIFMPDGEKVYLTSDYITESNLDNLDANGSYWNATTIVFDGRKQLSPWVDKWFILSCPTLNTEDIIFNKIGLEFNSLDGTEFTSYIQDFAIYSTEFENESGKTSDLDTTAFALNYTADDCNLLECTYESEEIQ